MPESKPDLKIFEMGELDSFRDTLVHLETEILQFTENIKDQNGDEIDSSIIDEIVIFVQNNFDVLLDKKSEIESTEINTYNYIHGFPDLIFSGISEVLIKYGVKPTYSILNNMDNLYNNLSDIVDERLVTIAKHSDWGSPLKPKNFIELFPKENISIRIFLQKKFDLLLGKIDLSDEDRQELSDSVNDFFFSLNEQIVDIEEEYRKLEVVLKKILLSQENYSEKSKKDIDQILLRLDNFYKFFIKTKGRAN